MQKHALECDWKSRPVHGASEPLYQDEAVVTLLGICRVATFFLYDRTVFKDLFINAKALTGVVTGTSPLPLTSTTRASLHFWTATSAQLCSYWSLILIDLKGESLSNYVWLGENPEIDLEYWVVPIMAGMRRPV
jgi:hypothetical protein